MSNQANRPRPFGTVSVADEIREQFSKEFVRRAISQLRSLGGTCWYCGKDISPYERVGMVVDVGSKATRAGFIHYEHAPSQVRDFRRNRAMSLDMFRYLEELRSDSQAYVSLRPHMTPRCSLVVSPAASQVIYDGQEDLVDPWISYWLKRGFALLVPPILDASAAPLEGWTLDVAEGDLVKVSSGEDVLFDGELPIPDLWKVSAVDEGECTLIVSGIGVVSGLESTALGALDRYASEGLVVGATVPVTIKELTHTGASFYPKEID
jgi:hypothetical protein